MTTSTPEPAAPSGYLPFESHKSRQMAESFGAEAERYDRARPSYPADLVERVVAAMPGRDLLDVGCGTGIAARLFLAAGCRVLGVDVDERMAGLARRAGIDVEVTKFEEWDAGDRKFDAVTAGQAWHWVDPVAGAAAAGRVLRPGGLLAVFWNAFGLPPGLAEEFAAVYRRVIPDSPLGLRPIGTGPEAYSAFTAKAADGMRQAGAFGEPEEWRFPWERPYTRDEWVDMLPTAGISAQIPAATMRELQDGVAAAIDAAGGGFTMRYTTVAISAARTA